MTISETHWDTWNDIFVFWINESILSLSILTESAMCLHFVVQEEDIMEHINPKVSVVYNFSQLVDHYVT